MHGSRQYTAASIGVQALLLMVPDFGGSPVVWMRQAPPFPAARPHCRIIAGMCLHKPSCSVPAWNKFFKQDPCPHDPKTLTFKYT